MLPDLQTSIPGPQSQALIMDLRAHESRNVTYNDSTWPVFWERAEGVNVWDADGNRFLDLTSAFGVAGLGHRNQEVVDALHAQADQLLHGMGDVHPTRLKGALCRELSRVTFERWEQQPGKVVLSNSGFEAIETALKTARLATGKRKIVAFENAYHGLGYGSLMGTDLSKFRSPFEDQLADVTIRVPYGTFEDLDAREIGAVLMEPIQGRGGKVVPPPEFLSQWRAWCDANEVLLIFDEIYTGFWRTGKFFACEWDQVVPDLICVGKAMSGGFPISACIGRSALMDAWPESTGEALHTSTFLGHPLGCAMALKSLEILQRPDTQSLVEKAAASLEKKLKSLPLSNSMEVRGRGLMWGLVLPQNCGALLPSLLQKGILMLADGPEGNVLSFTPPFIISEEEIDYTIAMLKELEVI